MSIRFPKVCLRCGALGHYSEDCTRMPTNMGRAPQEVDYFDAAVRQRNAIVWAAVAVIGGLILFGTMGA